MKRRFLALFTLSLLAQASALTLGGQVEGKAAPGTRLSAWVVRGAGQPLEELASTALSGATFSLSLPTDAPPTQAQQPVDSRVAWPGLMDFGRASAAAQAAEVKFFLYRDANGNGQRDESEALREVRLNAGRGFVFVVWASNDVTVTGSNGYSAELRKGWNALSVDVRSAVHVQSLDPKANVTVSTGQ